MIKTAPIFSSSRTLGMIDQSSPKEIAISRVTSSRVFGLNIALTESNEKVTPSPRLSSGFSSAWGSLPPVNPDRSFKLPMDGLGLLMVVFSYAGRISIGMLACRDVLPDPEQLGEYLLDSLQQLESALSPLEFDEPAMAEVVLRAAEERMQEQDGLDGESPAREALEQLRQATRNLEKAIKTYRPDGAA